MVLLTGDRCWICGSADWSSFFIHRADTAWKEAVQCPCLPKPRFGGTTTENQRLVQCLLDLVLCQDCQEDFMVNVKCCWILCSVQLLKLSAVLHKVWQWNLQSHGQWIFMHLRGEKNLSTKSVPIPCILDIVLHYWSILAFLKCLFISNKTLGNNYKVLNYGCKINVSFHAS